MTFCAQVQKWIEDKVQKPLETWFQGQKQVCSSRKRWWQRLLCWFATYLILIISYIIIIVLKVIMLAICVVVQSVVGLVFAILTLISKLIGLTLSVPFVGALIKNLLNLILEIIWRVINNILDIFLGVFNIEKKIKVIMVVLKEDGNPVVQSQYVDAIYNKARQILKTECNIRLIRNYCTPPKFNKNARKQLLYHSCGKNGSFSFGINGSVLDNAIATQCENFFDFIGYGTRIFVIFNRELRGCNGLGLTPTITKNHIIIDSNSQVESLAHQIGHISGWFFHSTDKKNLMYNGNLDPNPELTPNQQRTIRSSRFCTYI